MLRSERSERLEAWAADTLLLPTLRDGPPGLLRVRSCPYQQSMKAGTRSAAARIPMQRNLFTYIWHSRHEQLVILSLVVLAQIFYFMSLTVPKSIVNNGIQGNAFKQHTTIPFLAWELDLSAIFHGHTLRLFEGFQVDQLTYLIVMSFVFLAAVIINGQFKKSINTQKGRMGERMLRRLRYELYDRILRFPPAHFR